MVRLGDNDLPKRLLRAEALSWAFDQAAGVERDPAPTLADRLRIQTTLGEILAELGLRQFRVYVLDADALGGGTERAKAD